MGEYIWAVQAMIIFLTVSVVRSHSFAIKKLGRFVVYSANILLIMLWCSMAMMYADYYKAVELFDFAVPLSMTSTMGLLTYGVLCAMEPKNATGGKNETSLENKKGLDVLQISTRKDKE